MVQMNHFMDSQPYTNLGDQLLHSTCTGPQVAVATICLVAHDVLNPIYKLIAESS